MRPRGPTSESAGNSSNTISTTGGRAASAGTAAAPQAARTPRIRVRRRRTAPPTVHARALSQTAEPPRLRDKRDEREAAMKVFVAGATGAIGRRLVPLLVENGHEVVGMTRKPANADALRAAGAEPAVADALDG